MQVWNIICLAIYVFITFPVEYLVERGRKIIPCLHADLFVSRHEGVSPPCFPFHIKNIIEGCGYSRKADFFAKKDADNKNLN